MQVSRLFLVGSLFSLGQYASAANNGIIGFGLSLWPDLCAEACYYSVYTLYLTCTTFPNSTSSDSSMDMDMSDSDMDSMPMTSQDCYDTNTPWLQTMAYCIQQRCDADRFPVKQQAISFSTLAIAGASTPTFEESIPATAPTVELAADAVWLNSTSLVNDSNYYMIYGSLKVFRYSEYMHTKYAVALVLTVFGVFLLCGLGVQFGILFPRSQKKLRSFGLLAKVRQYLVLPPLFGTQRLEPLPGQVGYVPGRMLSIFIFVYVALNIVFSAVNFTYFTPNFFYASPEYQLCEYIGNRTGTLSLVNTAIAILFAGRLNPLVGLTGWSQTTFLTLHRWSARVATVQAIIHSVAYTVGQWAPGYMGAVSYAAQLAMPYWWWGIIATVAYAMLASASILPFRIKFYDTFLLLHIGLAILALVALWYHLVPHFGFIYGYQVWLYVCFAFWAADRGGRLLRVAWYNGLGRSKAIVEAVPGCDVFQVTVHPRVGWKFGPGQHSFLYMPDIGAGKFWENHPFSIARWSAQGPSLALRSKPISAAVIENEEKIDGTATTLAVTTNAALASYDGPSIQFMIRGHTGMTSALRKHMSLYSYGESMELSILNEGPYAGHKSTLQPLLEADTILCLIGGIGITHALGFVQEFANTYNSEGELITNRSKFMRKAKRFIFAWTAKEMALIEHVRNNLLIDCEGIEYMFWHTGVIDSPSKSEKITSRRMDIGSVIRSSLEPGLQTTVLSCGPCGMADEARQNVIRFAKNGYQVELIEEAFAW
ncbi:ferric reductase like transmembrane component [Xylariaceae sp. FL0255]|nr:ferric reductase like transmembrane component [Xylariaceae sp. FL0255]